jgi:hypothetical protein
VHRFPLLDSGAIVGHIEVGVDSSFVRSKLQDLALDIGVILLVALVAAYEVTLMLSHRFVGGRSATRKGRLAGGAVDIRLVLFLFVIGEELSKSFMPQYIQRSSGTWCR